MRGDDDHSLRRGPRSMRAMPHRRRVHYPHRELRQHRQSQRFPPTNTTYAAIGCQTCHEPHGQTIPTNDNHLIRVMASATFGDGTVITNGGEGNLCMNCHHSRNGSAVTNVVNYPVGLPTWARQHRALARTTARKGT